MDACHRKAELHSSPNFQRAAVEGCKVPQLCLRLRSEIVARLRENLICSSHQLSECFSGQLYFGRLCCILSNGIGQCVKGSRHVFNAGEFFFFYRLAGWLDYICVCVHICVCFVSETERDAVLIMPKDRDFKGGGA